MTYSESAQGPTALIGYCDRFEDMSITETADEVAAIVGEPVSLWTLPLPEDAPTALLVRESRPGGVAVNHVIVAARLDEEMRKFAVRHEFGHLLRLDHLADPLTASPQEATVLAAAAEHFCEQTERLALVGCRKASEEMAAAERECELFAVLLGLQNGAVPYHKLARTLQGR